MKKVIVLFLLFSVTVFGTCQEEAERRMKETKIPGTGNTTTTTEPTGGIDPGGDPDQPR